MTRRSPGTGSTRKDGYTVIGCKGHPIANASGYTYLHRLVLYGEIGPGPHSCHVCAVTVDWGGRGGLPLWVDHLDWDKTNNDPLNLAPSCPRCNSIRWKDRNDAGQANPNAKLTDEQAEAIRQDPGRQVDIATRHGVSQTTVSKIKCGQRLKAPGRGTLERPRPSPGHTIPPRRQPWP